MNPAELTGPTQGAHLIVRLLCLVLCAAGCSPSDSTPADGGTDGGWVIPKGQGILYRAVHIGGKWGLNVGGINTLPEEFFIWLRDLNVEWVGVSVALHVESSMDSTVERRYENVSFPSFTDEELRRFVGRLRGHGFRVYLTLAFETADAAKSQYPVERWQLGDPRYPEEDPGVDPAYWPWSLDHPDNERFVDEFFETYTERAVEVGALAQQAGVELYSLGTETTRLFRTRAGGYWPNHYADELRRMVLEVRKVYQGPLTYDMYYGVFQEGDFYLPGSYHLWEDLGLDVIGISAYFVLLDQLPAATPAVETLRDAWQTIWTEHLEPLKADNPDRPLLFLEFGYVDTVESPARPAAGEYDQKVFSDADGDGLDDGEQTQANVYRALFDVIDQRPGVVDGAFLWGHDISTDSEWAAGPGRLRTFAVRGKLAEQVVRERYAAWRQGP